MSLSAKAREKEPDGFLVVQPMAKEVHTVSSPARAKARVNQERAIIVEEKDIWPRIVPNHPNQKVKVKMERVVVPAKELLQPVWQRPAGNRLTCQE